MAKTYPVQQVKILTDFDAFGGKWTYQQEGATQGATLKGAPLLWNAGQVDQTADVPAVGTIASFAMQDLTGIQGTLVKTIDANWIMAAGHIDANLVASANPIVNHTFALDDLGDTFSLTRDTATGLWVADESTQGAGVTMTSWDVWASFLFPDEETGNVAEVDDINVRLRFKLLESALDQ